MSERTDSDFARDIEEAIKRISAYSAGLTYETFLLDTKTQDAIVRNLEIIGEAAKKISDQVRAQHATIPWKSMAGVRDRLIHDYFGVSFDVVWEIISNDLPQVVDPLKRLLDEKASE
ncbi:MAG TPA: DUF86 domain-containing protein [Pyrinomonadaceae bacterium]|nr:DUF86 domain-containing protein [Pyrinomonadaceae bacterium]